MNIVFTTHGWEDFTYWLENDADTAIKIKNLLKEIKSNPFKGIGKPEPLKHGLKGFWSRRITGEHRLVYKVSGKKGIDQKCTIIQCRFHYDDK
ncbi:Txe/YoeB family addiction module toxin [Mesonia oceanica]|uniref:Toxin YoeB n=1 Tax=Mesonia oceanica TaxID=2687242 RepID=A0AC61YE47_9FLAO|nr:Txe/YoeB family addiction module toxin [Mesonia oceanica]MAQ40691.1 Txe/YoeB family addiction module toxin [Mesonia sp.]MBJ96373.1 Txe/YoeB family addiction module toxin [Flavobacteriaceae bacterium]VVV02225.1 Toxin YoeB [Mesonia oceanica]|tara:strand:- start:18 stop:296 length:279 start_codon:yes stop_codon:yes gene_type:complete